MVYADYEYYTDIYKGSILTKALFEAYSDKAQCYIDYITLGRAEFNLNENVKKAVCAAAESLYLHAGKRGIISENTDGYSVTYSNDERNDVIEAVKMYLVNTGMFYAAVSGEKG